MDLWRYSRLFAPMDAQTTDQIAQLCAQVGMIMEDASPRALMVEDRSESGLRSTISDLRDATNRMSALLDAATALI